MRVSLRATQPVFGISRMTASPVFLTCAYQRFLAPFLTCRCVGVESYPQEEELKWVEDNIPTGGGDGSYGGPSDDISLDINGETTRHRLL